MTGTPTRDLFLQALGLVRSAPLENRRSPAFVLPTADRAHSGGSGPVTGLAGDLWETSARVASGDLSPAAVLAECEARVKAYDGRYGAFEHVDWSAFAAPVGDRSLPLHGIPMTVKDVIHVAGMPSTGSSKAIPPVQATIDGTAVARLRAAGASIIGKVVTHEFALGVTTPQSHSPWDERLVPGGSSGGSAISVLTGMALASLGTDTRASIRVPAALCGLVGFKPSYGRIPVDEWLTLSWSLDHFAPLARSVRDVAKLMDLLAGPPGTWTDALPGSLAGVRIGSARAFLRGCEPGVDAAFDAALEAARAAGATVVEVDSALTDDDLELANAVGMILSRAEAAQFHLESGTDLSRCIPEVRDQLTEARAVLATDYLRAVRLRGQLRDRLLAMYGAADFVAMPTSKVVAPLREDADQYLLVLSANCIPWSLVDFPAISVFAGLSGGLPVGLQLVGPPGDDRALLAVAHGFEQALPPPPVWSPR